MNGISALVRDPRQLSPPTTNEYTARRQLGRGFSRFQICQCLGLGFSASKTVRNKLLLFVSHSGYGILL